jgi:glucosamine-6-phosphate deaminase
LVDGTGDIEKNIKEITTKLRQKPIDVGVIGIGENGHVAFNDPPADFDNDNAYIVVDLDEKCKMQQVGEGWFDTIDDVPKKAISITVKEILKCKVIVSAVPHMVKAKAVKDSLLQEVNNMVPGTILKTHDNFNLFLDANSASGFLKY